VIVVNGKQFVIATVFAMVLLTMVFIPISSQQLGTYDPWLDYNEDGKIDIRDLATAAKAYGTLGDPTKNVNVTNWPLDYRVQTVSINVTWENYYGFCNDWVTFAVGGYSRLTMSFNPTNMSERASEVTVTPYQVSWWFGEPPKWGYAYDNISSDLFVVTAHKSPSGSLSRSGHTSILETKANYCNFRFNCSSPDYSGWATFDVLYYLRNE